MREILFRGKSMYNGEWIYGSFFYDNDVVTILPNPTCIGCGFGGLWWIDDGFDPVDRETVGQFTGLTDKHGTKIFEGDIVRCVRTHCDGKEVVGHIIFEDCCFCVKKGIDRPAMDLCGEFEVIGNIHDNPELLTKNSAIDDPLDNQ